MDAYLDLDIVQLAEQAGVGDAARGEHGGRPAKLKVYCRDQAFAMAQIDDGVRLLQGLAHRLLDQYRCAVGQQTAIL